MLNVVSPAQFGKFLIDQFLQATVPSPLDVAKDFLQWAKYKQAESQKFQDHLQALGIDRLERQKPSDVLNNYQASL